MCLFGFLLCSDEDDEGSDSDDDDKPMSFSSIGIMQDTIHDDDTTTNNKEGEQGESGSTEGGNKDDSDKEKQTEREKEKGMSDGDDSSEGGRKGTGNQSVEEGPNKKNNNNNNKYTNNKETVDLSKMSERERKLYELRQKIKKAEYDNRKEIREDMAKKTAKKKQKEEEDEKIAEALDMKHNKKGGNGNNTERNEGKGVGTSTTGGGEGEGDHDHDSKTDEYVDPNADPKLSYLRDPALVCESAREAKERKAARAAAVGWEVHGDAERYKAFDKRIHKLPTAYIPDTSAPLDYIPASKPTPAQLDKLAETMQEDQKKRETFSRRRRDYEAADINYINDDNKQFNKKAGKYYDQYSAEIKRNLERGTAL